MENIVATIVICFIVFLCESLCPFVFQILFIYLNTYIF